MLLSVLAKGDPGAVVTGLDSVAPDEWPPVPIVHAAFQVMVACGLVLGLLALCGAILLWRGKLFEAPRFLLIAALSGPLGLLAVEAGWVVTEVGRQPWIISGVLRVADAVTPMPGLQYTLLGTVAVYLFLGTVVVVLLRRLVIADPVASEPVREEVAL